MLRSLVRMSSAVRKNGDFIVACHPEKYDELFHEKRSKLSELLKWPVDQIVPYSSPTSHFRMRTNFQLWHDNGKERTPQGCYYAMFDEVEKKPHEIITFPRGTHRINELMIEVRKAMEEIPVIFDSLFEVRFVTTKHNEEALILLCYKRPLTKDWLPTAEKLAEKIGGVKIIGRARNMMQITKYNNPTGSEYIQERLTVNDRTFTYYQTEGAFSQPNAVVCEKMLTWAVEQTKNSHDHDLLELYCGGGTFTAPLSYNFNKVLATEISKSSVQLAKRCFQENNIDNIKVLRLSSEEFTEFYCNHKEFGRLKEEKININDYNIKTVFVDPPRAGLDIGTCQLVSLFHKIVYVSCNPITLARDVEILSKTHQVISVAAFDQFPYTEHLESGVVLIKKEEEVAEETGKEEHILDRDSSDENPTKRQKITDEN